MTKVRGHQVRFEMPSEGKTATKPNLSMLALISFTVSFLVARTFTTLNPDIVLIGGGFHIHHFWYGIVMLAIGGWLGISYQNERTDRIAAILFGAGGGLISDEVGLLLTFGNYWTGVTYMVMVLFLTSMVVLILLRRYSEIISAEFTQVLRSHATLYFGVFLAAVSMAFTRETNSTLVTIVSSVLTITGFLIILIYFMQRIKVKQ
jgi:hypothetical protein